MRAELERLAEAAGKREALALLYRAQLKTAAEPLALELWRAAALTHQTLAQAREAAEAWEEVARRRPGDEEPLVALCALYRGLSDFKQLPRLLRHRAELKATVPEQLDLLHELVEVAEQRLSDPALAIESCRLAYTRAPDDARTVAALERLLEGNRHFDALAQVLTERIERAGARTTRGR